MVFSRSYKLTRVVPMWISILSPNSVLFPCLKKLPLRLVFLLCKSKWTNPFKRLLFQEKLTPPLLECFGLNAYFTRSIRKHRKEQSFLREKSACSRHLMLTNLWKQVKEYLYWAAHFQWSSKNWYRSRKMITLEENHTRLWLIQMRRTIL